jgi:hypothetical protein
VITSHFFVLFLLRSRSHSCFKTLASCENVVYARRGREADGHLGRHVPKVQGELKWREINRNISKANVLNVNNRGFYQKFTHERHDFCAFLFFISGCGSPQKLAIFKSIKQISSKGHLPVTAR